jgi:hypothetical protein
MNFSSESAQTVISAAARQMVTAKGWTIQQAARETGLSEYSVRRMMTPEWYKLRVSVPIKFFERFGVKFDVKLVPITPR